MVIPKECMPVVDILRRDIRRPELPLVSVCKDRFCRFETLVTAKDKGRKCPMGLHPTAEIGAPVILFKKGPFTIYAQQCVDTGSSPTRKFADWWDSLSFEEAKEAIDLIWKKVY